MSGGIPFAVWLPAATVFASVAGALVADALGRRQLAVWLVVAGLAVAAAACLLFVPQPALSREYGLVWGAGYTTLPGVGYLLAAVSVAASAGRAVRRDRGIAVAALVALGASFAHALIAAADVRVLFVALSGSAVVAYGLAAGAGTRQAEESAVRYVVQGIIASAVTVWGLALVVGLGEGATGYRELAVALATVAARPGVLAAALLLSVVAFKTGAFPFHSWAPDVYETADPGDVAFLASAPKIAGLVAALVLVRGSVFSGVGPASTRGVLVAVAVASLVFGSFGMVRQRSVGRLLGYSAIAQAGLGLAAVAATSGAFAATAIFAVTYAVGVTCAFVSLEAVRAAHPDWDGSVEGLAGLARRSPVLAFCLAASMFSLAGVPPLAGFWGKIVVFLALVRSGMAGLAVLAALGAVVAFAGYGSVVRSAYFDDACERVGERALRRDLRGVVVTGVAVALVVAFGAAPVVLGLGRIAEYFGLG